MHKASQDGLTTEFPATIVLDLNAHLFLKNDECAGPTVANKISLFTFLKFSITFLKCMYTLL